MAVNFDAIPEEPRDRHQWMIWKYEERNGITTKVPYQVNGKKASSTNPKTWCTFDAAKKALDFHVGDGIGFAFTRDSFSGVDLDHCRDPSTGSIDAWAVRYIEILNSYTEVSPSGEGIHVIVKGCIPEGRTGGKKNFEGNGYRPKAAIEIYSEGRYFTFTGNTMNGNTAVQGRQDELRGLYLEIFGAEEEVGGKSAATPTTPTAATPIPPKTVVIELSDKALILKAMTAKNVDLFKALWDGSTLGYGHDASAADMALCNHLAFWTRKNPQQMDRLFRQSKLMRPKWDEKHGVNTYGDMTINKAISDCREVYEPHTENEDTEDVEIADQNDLTPTDVLDKINSGPERTNEDGSTWQPKKAVFNHARAVDAILTKLPVVLGTDGLLYYFQGSKWSNQAEEILHNKLHSLAGKHFTQHQHKEVIAALKSLLTFSKVKLDPDPWLLGVANGVVDLRTSEFREYREEDYISYSINVKYDMLATCPRFILFLEEVCPRVVDRLTLVDWLTIHAIGKQFPYVQFLLGNGRNGKGVFEKLLIAIYERSAFSFIGLDELQKSVFAKANLAGRRGLIVSEAGDENVKGKAVLPTKFLKGSTGDGIIDSDQKNKNRIQFDPIFKSTIDCNDMPRIRDRSRGWEERFCKVDMPYTFVDNPDPKNIYERKKDPRLIDKLTTPKEQSGILNLIILRAAEIFKTETIIKRSGKTTMAEYLVQSDSIRAFLDAFCEYSSSVKVEDAASVRDAYAAYERFCQYPPKDKAVIEQFGQAIKKLCNNLEPKKIDNIKRYPGFVFYKDEFEEYMRSSADPIKSSDNPDKSITDPVNPVYDHIWEDVFHGRNVVEIKKSFFGHSLDSLDPVAISKPESSKQVDQIANPVDNTRAPPDEHLCAKCHKHMGMSAVLPGLGEVCLDCLEAST